LRFVNGLDLSGNAIRRSQLKSNANFTPHRITLGTQVVPLSSCDAMKAKNVRKNLRSAEEPNDPVENGMHTTATAQQNGAQADSGEVLYELSGDERCITMISSCY
jgi:hypothetical protein